MTRVLFLQRILTENLGPMYLSAIAKQHGHDCLLQIEDGKADNRIFDSYRPDIVAFSVTTGIHQWALKRAAEIKKHYNVKVIIGGPHATFFPEVVANPAVDVIFRGEAEHSFIQYLEAPQSESSLSKIPNIWYKEGTEIVKNDLGTLVEDMDTLPSPDRALYYDRYPYFKKNENKPFISGRGCPYSCTYCSIAGLRELYRGKGRFVRFHSPERVIDEIITVRDKYGLRSVIFQDDTFILGPERLDKLLTLYEKRVKLPFICHIRADLLTHDIARHLKSAGCHSVDFGVETGDEELRQTLLGKGITDAHLKQAAAILHEVGIPFRTTNMFGLPGETYEQALKTFKINQELKTNFPSASVYQPYPRTALGDHVIQSGLAGENYSVDAIGSSFFRTSLLNKKDMHKFINLQKFFWLGVRFPKLMPLIKILVKAPPNFIYEGIFLLCYAINYTLSEKVSVRHVLNIGRRTAKTVFFGKM